MSTKLPDTFDGAMLPYEFLRAGREVAGRAGNVFLSHKVHKLHIHTLYNRRHPLPHVGYTPQRS